MGRIVVSSRVGSDGVLRLTVPLGAADANREVRVTVEPAGATKPKPMTQAEWRQFVMSTAGSVTDPSFIRHEQGEYERREELP